MAARIGLHQWTLAIAHLAAFVGTGIAWLKMNPPYGLPPSYQSGGVLAGAFYAGLLSVLWASWPFVASFFVSRAILPGRTSATWVFVCILVPSAVAGGYLLNSALMSP